MSKAYEVMLRQKSTSRNDYEDMMLDLYAAIEDEKNEEPVYVAIDPAHKADLMRYSDPKIVKALLQGDWEACDDNQQYDEQGRPINPTMSPRHEDLEAAFHRAEKKLHDEVTALMYEQAPKKEKG